MSSNERDFLHFPDDSNGAVLWHMKSEGDSLISPREIDFSAVFPSEENAIEFAVLFLRNSWKVEMFESEPNDKDQLNWAVMLYTTIIPSHEEISNIEATISDLANQFEGRFDGWSSVFIPSP